MTSDDVLADRLFAAVEKFCEAKVERLLKEKGLTSDSVVAPIVERVLAQLPAPVPGKDGAPGKDADMEQVRTHLKELVAALPRAEPGKDGAPGKDADPEAVAALLQRMVAEIPPPAPGRDGVDGKPGIDGAPGQDGQPGKDADPAFVRALVDEAVAALPPPAPGRDGRDGVDGQPGKDIDPLTIRAMMAEIVAKEIAAMPPAAPGKDGVDGQAGKDGLHGKDIDPIVVEAMITKAVAAIPPATDGRDGRDGARGEPGRDALQIEPELSIDEKRSYPRGTWASHKGGLWRATKNTQGMEGWTCMVDGVAHVEAIQDPEDPRRIALGMKMASGEVRDWQFAVPFVIDRGVYKDTQAYRTGDGVTWNRGYWIAQRDTGSKPDYDGGDWRLAIKGARDGKDGRDGIDKTVAVKL